MKKALIVHPYLVALFPILFLFSRNLFLALPPVQALRPTLITISFSFLLWLLLRKLIDSEKAGLAVSFFLLSFFVYEPVYKKTNIAMDRTLYSIGFLLILAMFVIFLIKTNGNLRVFTNALNITGLILVAMPLINIANHLTVTFHEGAFETESHLDSGRTNGEGKNDIDQQRVNDLPSIYYLVLDGYARADVLDDLYGNDNEEFLHRLEAMGFYIARRSNSNYAQTVLSLASSLNLQYLDDVASRLGPASNNRRPLTGIIENSCAVDFLKGFGYRFVALTSGYAGVMIPSADFGISRTWSVTEFEQLVIKQTPIPLVYDQWGAHRERIRSVFDRLVETQRLDPPLFVLAHVLSPHPPFLFGEDGEEINPAKKNPKRSFTYADGIDLRVGLDQDEYRAGYKGQLLFINKKVETVVEQIILDSQVPPIIVLQSDHGPSSILDTGLSTADVAGLRERMPILNAYYFPDGDYKNLYEGVSPVNSFRILFNKYFRTDFRLLEDKSFFSTWDKPYDFINVTSVL